MTSFQLSNTPSKVMWSVIYIYKEHFVGFKMKYYNRYTAFELYMLDDFFNHHFSKKNWNFEIRKPEI
jgi:hypothetical protein